MLPGVVLQVRSTGNYGSSLHIVRIENHTHKRWCYHFLGYSLACEHNL
jgi:hypothetical protein